MLPGCCRREGASSISITMEPPVPTSIASFPVLTVSIAGILFTLMLLLTYYVFVLKCCLNWQHSGIISRLRRQRRWPEPSSVLYSSSPTGDRGLDESTIQAIPTFRYRKRGESIGGRCFQDCAVCLNELQEEEKMRLLPNCFHVFHVDCIDTWLQKNDSCPVCRSSITVPSDHHLMALAPPHDHGVIDVENGESYLTGRVNSSSSTRKSEWRSAHRSKGDECIVDVRYDDGDFCVQPVRRSFSMDSSGDRQLYTTLKKILQQNPHFQDVSGEIGSSSSRRIRRSIFYFGRSSRGAILPLQIEQ